LRGSPHAILAATMNPLATATMIISGTVMFVSTVFLATSTPIPFFGTQEPEGGVYFDFSGTGGNISLEEQLSPTRGWAVYGFGEYTDEDGDGNWDDCDLVEISIWGQSNENSTNETNGENFYPLCEQGFERDDAEEMVYLGQICYNPSNKTAPRCAEGIYTFESNTFVRLSQESEPIEQSLFSRFFDWIVSGLETGRTLLCGSTFLMILGILMNFIQNEEEVVDITKSDGKKGEWRAYSLTQTERGDDGLPKAFSRHTGQRELFRKPRKGNRKGGVHKSGGLYLGGWTEEDSDKEYKKKVEDRRDR